MGQDGDVEEGNIDGLIDTLSSQLKGIMSHFQVMGSFTVSVDVQWPAAFGDFCSGFSFMSLDLNSLFAMGCVASTNYFGNIMVTFLLPTVCFPGIFLTAVICNKLFGLEKELVKNKALGSTLPDVPHLSKLLRGIPVDLLVPPC